MASPMKLSLLAVLAMCAVACGGGAPEATSPEQKIARASERLRGSWLLVGFRPEDRLEPILASLLSVQLGRLTVVFDGTGMTAQGVGVRATRQYTVDSATGDQFTATIVDPVGARYAVNGTFQG